MLKMTATELSKLARLASNRRLASNDPDALRGLAGHALEVGKVLVGHESDDPEATLTAEAIVNWTKRQGSHGIR